jgi:hypothetical protein
MLLQELSRDTRTLLNNTHATREQMDEFLNTTGLFLNDILYSENKYNMFMDWLKNASKLSRNMLFVNIAMIDYLFDKHEKDEQYTKGEKLVCYAYDPKSNNVVVCNTVYGEYYDYYFNNFTELQQDLN